ncbi:Maf family protein [Agrococcus sp. SL85]|uniref:Maf family protein n=1 Tax=Agrococcus sp. SL85 TaxID=2995141 RepID=UPI00226CAD94|nr:Maf family protein [Agrococcus sp. SL85]WAC65253.1 Maf family protein [Agrococcus sp. SL85]
MQLILASASPARLALLRQAGIEPVVRPTDVDEDLLVEAHEAEHGPLAPDAYVLLLARAKAEALLDQDPLTGFDGLVLGGDSSLELDGAMLGKPHTPERARERWLQQRGREAVLHSGHSMLRVRGGRIEDSAHVATATSLRFAADIDESEIDAYVATGEPLQVAGAFTIDGRGAAFIDSISGDPSTVIGMSIPAVRRLARELGVAWPRLATA